MSKDYTFNITVAGSEQSQSNHAAPAPMPLEQLVAAADQGGASAPAPMALAELATGGPQLAPEPMAPESLPDPGN
ncbi:hypothetical protein [Glutamicibacter sp. NPDC087344]|uniref:hypothetical protein n=1 Tax=Glutamicibacter sp. NPDC087344 TaxID=3363994 RepID=UPI0038210B4A